MRWLLSAALLGTMLQTTGCASLNLNPLASKSETPPVAEKDTVGECQVNFKWGSGKTETRTVSLQADTTVQQVLAKSEAARKFSRMDITLARPLPNGAWHKMDVAYNRSDRRVESTNDYNVKPGDRLLVKEDTRTIIDDMVETAMGSSGKKLGQRLLK